MKLAIFIFSIILITNNLNSQIINHDLTKYDFSDTPKYNPENNDYQNESAVIIFEKRAYKYNYNIISVKGYLLKHQAIKILKSTAISKFNKINTDDGWVNKVIKFKARIIKLDGKIIDIPKDEIINSDVEKTKYLIIKDVEEGDIIEYFYLLDNYFDKAELIIYDEKIPNMSLSFYFIGNNFEIIHPSSPIYSFKQNSIISSDVYSNSSPKITLFQFTNLPAFNDVEYSNNYYNLIKIYFQLEPFYSYNYVYLTGREKKAKKHFKDNQIPVGFKSKLIYELYGNFLEFTKNNYSEYELIEYIITKINYHFKIKNKNEKIDKIKNTKVESKISADQFYSLFKYFL